METFIFCYNLSKWSAIQPIKHLHLHGAVEAEVQTRRVGSNTLAPEHGLRFNKRKLDN